MNKNKILFKISIITLFIAMCSNFILIVTALIQPQFIAIYEFAGDLEFVGDYEWHNVEPWLYTGEYVVSVEYLPDEWLYFYFYDGTEIIDFHSSPYMGDDLFFLNVPSGHYCTRMKVLYYQGDGEYTIYDGAILH